MMEPFHEAVEPFHEAPQMRHRVLCLHTAGPFCPPPSPPPPYSPPPVPAPNNYTFTSPRTGLVYMFSTREVNQSQAAAFCASGGGQLVSYINATEQVGPPQAWWPPPLVGNTVQAVCSAVT